MTNVKRRPNRMRPLGCGYGSRLLALLFCLLSGELFGQEITFSTQRDVTPPDYATFRIGPLYSTFAWTESIGYRYTTSSGTGTDYLEQNSRGTIKKDGSEIPILSALTFRNYLIISRNMDLDMSFRIGYYYYPLETEEDRFVFDMADEGITGNISTAFRLTDTLVGTLYDRIVYRTDYVDTRGLEDDYGGSEYEYLSNTLGANMTWDMGRRHSTQIGISRYDMMPSGTEFEDQESVQYQSSLTYRYQARTDLTVGFLLRYRDVDYTSTNRADTTEQSYSLYLHFGREGQETAGVQVTKRSTLRLSLGTSIGYTGDTGESSTGTDRTSTDDWENGSLHILATVELESLLSKRTTQLVSYKRGLRDGFNSPFEEYDTAEYRLKWASDFTTVTGFSQLRNVDPSLAKDVDYHDWVNGLSISWRATKAVTITASSTYTLRSNDSEDIADTSDMEAENVSDYETWVSRIGTAFKIAKEVTFSTSIQHVERFSEDEDLAYSRDTFLATLTYHHQF